MSWWITRAGAGASVMLSRIAARGAVGFIVVPFGVVGEICFQAAFGLIEGSLKSLQNLSRSGIYARQTLATNLTTSGINARPTAASAAAVWRRLRSGSGLPNAVAGQRLARAWWGAGCAIHGERHNVHIVAEGLFAARQFSALSHGQCGQQHHRNKIFLHFFILSFGGIRHTPPSHSGRGSSHLGNW